MSRLDFLDNELTKFKQKIKKRKLTLKDLDSRIINLTLRVSLLEEKLQQHSDDNTQPRKRFKFNTAPTDYKRIP